MTEQTQDIDKLIESYVKISKATLKTQKDTLTQLENIQQNINTIKNWVVFFGVFGTIYGFLAALDWLLINAW